MNLSSSLLLAAYCNANQASCPITWHFIIGYFIFLGQSPISWETEKQLTIFCFSAETKYCAMVATCCELKQLQELLYDLYVPQPNSIPIYCDSQVAMHITVNPVFHERTKYIEIDCHFVQDEYLAQRISLQYVPSSSQLADMFTKALRHLLFSTILRKLDIHNLHAPT